MMRKYIRASLRNQFILRIIFLCYSFTKQIFHLGSNGKFIRKYIRIIYNWIGLNAEALKYTTYQVQNLAHTFRQLNQSTKEVDASIKSLINQFLPFYFWEEFENEEN